MPVPFGNVRHPGHCARLHREMRDRLTEVARAVVDWHWARSARHTHLDLLGGASDCGLDYSADTNAKRHHLFDLDNRYNY